MHLCRNHNLLFNLTIFLRLPNSSSWFLQSSLLLIVTIMEDESSTVVEAADETGSVDKMGKTAQRFNSLGIFFKGCWRLKNLCIYS